MSVASSEIRPAVSVIIPTFNRENYIGAAVQSVLDQTFQDFEVLVVDDGSTDSTVQIIKGFPDKVCCLARPHLGRSSARNYALSVARGRYIAFLDSDDLYLPHKLEMQVEYLDAHPEIGMVYTSAHCVDESGKPLAPTYEATVSGDVYKDIAFYVPVTITLPTVMARREVFDRVGGFDLHMERFEDTDMWRRISKHYAVGALPQPTCKLRTHGGNALAAQDPHALESAIAYYLEKIRTEDKEGFGNFFHEGAAALLLYYAKAYLKTPAAGVGLRLLLKALQHAPLQVTYRLARDVGRAIKHKVIPTPAA